MKPLSVRCAQFLGSIKRIVLECVILLLAHGDCCVLFVPRLVFILRCKKTISVFVCVFICQCTRLTFSFGLTFDIFFSDSINCQTQDVLQSGSPISSAVPRQSSLSFCRPHVRTRCLHTRSHCRHAPCFCNLTFLVEFVCALFVFFVIQCHPSMRSYCSTRLV